MSGLHPLRPAAWAFAAVFLFASLFVEVRSFGQFDTLWQRIDAMASPDMPWLMAGPADETQALRRLSLDLRNTVPTIEEIDAFLAEPAQDRWARWVDRFLADPLHRERLVDWYDKTLVQRRAYQHVDRATWIGFLRSSVDSNTPLDAMLRGIVQSTWWNKSARAQQRFFLERGGDSHAIARDVGRVFFGKDLQCAQCHDHPQVEDYLQIDYHGLLAYVSSSSLLEGKTTDDKGAEQKLQMYIEKAAGDAPFESVFNKGVPFRSASRAPGQSEHFESYLAPDERYEATAREGTFGGLPNAPVQSRRALLASQLQASNRVFSENWANRLWAIMFGRGLVHPLDMHQFDNPASNPELLKLLTDSLIESQFNVSSVLRQIALSETYKRGRLAPIHKLVDARGVLQVQAPEALAWRAQITEALSNAKGLIAPAEAAWKEKQTAFETSGNAWREVQKSRIAVRAELDGAEAGFNDASKKLAEAAAALDKAAIAHKTIAQKVALLDEAAQKLEQAKALGDDPDIQNSIASTRAKVESLKPQVTAAEQAVVAATAARDGAAGVKETKRGEWKAIVDRLVPLEEQLRQADVAMTQAREAFQVSRRAASMLSERAQRLERVMTWFDRSAEVVGSQSQLAQLATQMTPMQETLSLANQEKVAVEQAMASLQGAIDQTNKQLEPIVGKWKELVAHKEKLSATKTQLAESKALLADPTSIDSAIAQFESSLIAKDAQLGTVDTQMKQMQATLADMQKKFEESKTQYVAATSKVQAQQAAIDTHKVSIQKAETLIAKVSEECSSLKAEVEESCQAVFAIAPERALSPEQFGWSILTATNVHAGYVANERAELDKSSPLAADLPADQLAIEQQARLLRMVRAARDKLQGTIDTFSNLYSSGVGQTSDDFFASPDQALFVANGGSIYGWAAPSGNNLTHLAIQAPDAQTATQILTRGLLARSAQAIELQWIPEMISKSPETKPAVIHELVWGILAGVEFRLYP
jgi:hypothetical protein